MPPHSHTHTETHAHTHKKTYSGVLTPHYETVMMCKNHSQLAKLDKVIVEYEPLINATGNNIEKMGHKRKPHMKIEAETGNCCSEART